MNTSPFLGLTMPVFTAFGWMGEETALKYALNQMEHFIKGMHIALSREGQMLFPHHGLEKTTQGVYLARNFDIDKDVYITFHAKPLGLRTAITITDRTILAKAFKAIQSNHTQWLEGLEKLGNQWELRLQQMEFNPDTGEATHYKDLYKDNVTALGATESAELIDRMVYLNGEEKWLAPIYLTKKVNSEFVAAMGTAVTREIATEFDEALPLMRLLCGGVRKPSGKKTTVKKTTTSKKRSKATSASAVADNKVEEFTYNALLKPLHIRKGFINMTASHWPFFAINSRTVTREITLHYDGHVDKKSTVWRMISNGTARVVLSNKAQAWLEDNFVANNEIQVHTTKDGKEISISLALVQEETA